MKREEGCSVMLEASDLKVDEQLFEVFQPLFAPHKRLCFFHAVK